MQGTQDNYYDFDFRRYLNNRQAVNAILMNKAKALAQQQINHNDIDRQQPQDVHRIVPQQFSRIEQVQQHKMMSVDLSAIDQKPYVSLETIPILETIPHKYMSQPQLIYYINGVRLELVLSKVQKLQADVLVGYFDNKLGKIYPMQYIMKKHGNIEQLKMIIRANRDCQALEVTDPQYKLFYLVGLQSENYVSDAISEVMNLVFLEKTFNSIVIPYISHDDKPSHQNSIAMIAQIHEMLMKEGILPFRLRITLMAQNADKFKSLVRAFRRIIDKDVEVGEVTGV